MARPVITAAAPTVEEEKKVEQPSSSPLAHDAPALATDNDDFTAGESTNVTEARPVMAAAPSVEEEKKVERSSSPPLATDNDDFFDKKFEAVPLSPASKLLQQRQQSQSKEGDKNNANSGGSTIADSPTENAAAGGNRATDSDTTHTTLHPEQLPVVMAMKEPPKPKSSNLPQSPLARKSRAYDEKQGHSLNNARHSSPPVVARRTAPKKEATSHNNPPMESPLRQQQHQKQQEAKRLLQQVQRLQKEAEMLEKLERVQKESAELKRSLNMPLESYGSSSLVDGGAAAFDRSEYNATERNDSPLASQTMQNRSNHLSLDSSDYSDYSSEQSPSVSPSVARPGMRHKISNMMKRRSPPNSLDPDVESQSKNKKEISPRTVASRPAAGRHDFSGRVLLRNICAAVFTNPDDETLRREGTDSVVITVTLLKEAMLGIFLAFLALCLFMFLDHYFLMHLSSARYIRKATFALMNDQETLMNLEKNAGLKFVDMEGYNSMMDEIKGAEERARKIEVMVERRSDELAGLEKERDRYSEELPKIWASTDMDKFCGTCIWSQSQKITCIQRVEALEATYKTPRYVAMESAMKKEACKKSSKDVEEERRQKKEEIKLMAFWEENQEDYCEECEWEPNQSCGVRVQYLNERYNVPLDRAKATAMMEAKTCTNSFQVAEEERLKKFCGECEWGQKLTCQQRVEYLVYTYKNVERVAKFSAMKRPACTI
mmetsp:Transcript_6022/g.10577  ORF Transcript_6022/g.10577 Transcript_6022/m.10577 type:complete len:717 (+) Transcript_6022:3-2153(+)